MAGGGVVQPVILAGCCAPLILLFIVCSFIMEFIFEIKGDIRNFTKEEFAKMLDILGQCGIDNFAELVKLYEDRYGCKR